MKKRLPHIYKGLLLALLLMSTATAAWSQATFEWAKKMGGVSSDAGRAIVSDESGNVYTTGIFMDTVDFDPGIGIDMLIAGGNQDAFISKLNDAGDLVWARKIGGGPGSATIARGISIDGSGNIYITGHFFGSVDFDPNTGTVTHTSVGTGTDAFICKLDALGNYVWSKQFEGETVVEANSIKVDGFGHVYATGRFERTVDFDPSSGMDTITSSFYDIGVIIDDYNGFVVKLDTAGNYNWARNTATFNKVDYGGGTVNATALGIDTAGNVYTTGYFSGYCDFNPGADTFYREAYAEDMFVSKLDSAGNFVWAKTWGTYDGQWGYASAVDNAGNIYVATFSQNDVDFDPGPGTFFITGSGTVISKLDGSGDFSWAKYITPQVGYLNSDGYGVATDLLGDVYITGRFTGTNDFDPGADTFNMVSSPDYFTDIYILKLDTAGAFVWAKSMGGAAANDEGRAIHVANNGAIYTTGTFNGTADFDPAATNFELTSNGGTDIFVHKMNQIFCVPTNATFTITGCDSATLNGQTYYATGTYNQTLLNAAGCDSIVTIHLTINAATQHTVIVPPECDSVSINGQTYTSSGTYAQTLTNANGCDSVLSLVVSINNSTLTDLTETACSDFLFNDTIYTQSGIYTATYTQSNGCDSVVKLTLTIPEINTDVTQNGATLGADEPGMSYQWMNCATNTIIFGANNQNYTAAIDGSYAVIVTNGDCKDTSDCYTVAGLAVNEMANDDYIQVFPNPSSGKVTVATFLPLYDATLRVVDILGRELTVRRGINGRSYSFDMKGYASGTYIIELEESGKKGRIKLVKD